jgi:hypothetical protein
VKPRYVVLPALFMASSLVLSGCSPFEEEKENIVYCVDDQDKIVDPDECERNSSGGGGTSPLFWYMMGQYNSGLTPGTRIDRGLSTSRFDPRDTAARSNAGLPKTGTVSNGTKVTSKSGGFGTGKSSSGKSGSGSGKSGGFGSGGGTGG